MIYTEDKLCTQGTKQAYVDGLYQVLAQRQQDAAKLREEYIQNIFDDPETYRRDLRSMLGWPLADHQTTGLPKVAAELLSTEDSYSIYRMHFEILDGLTMTGLLFRTAGKKPLVIVQHGGQGTPEHIAGIYGSTTNYNDMLHRVRNQDVHVFAPQLLLWHEDYGVEYDRSELDARLKRVGSSIAAVEIYGITRIIDYFEMQDFVSAFGMVGLSYGGFYTLYTAAIDVRIRSALSCAYFNTRDEIGWSDWTWQNSSQKFDDAEIACLVYPRRLCIAIAEHDPLFDCKHGMRSFDRLTDFCKRVGTDWTELIVFDGTHEFYKNDAPIQRLVNDLKGE